MYHHHYCLIPDIVFVPEELITTKKKIHSHNILSSTTLSNSSQKQAYNLEPPSFLVYTPTPPQIFEIGKSSIKEHLKHHEKQIEDILYYLEELSFHRIEKMEERLVNELLPPKKQIHSPSSSSTTLSNSSRKQAYNLEPPSFLVYTPTPSRIFEIGESSIKEHLKHHEKQIEDIL
ncbi:hypothetical protein Tco_1068573 [Tanacetum coccineum]|uniref:Uncharacterized protein n=1 Tax=Tanacetum coccineum TaxID=301880 RepID=A0ABQ5HGA2_9ASTR